MKRKANSTRSTTALGFTLTRTFDAPPRVIFEAWTKPEHLKKWSAPRGFIIPHSEGELRLGGKWRACMRTPDGEDLWLGGVYQQVVADTSLVFTHAWEEEGKRDRDTLVSVHFEADGQGTRLTLSQTGFDSVEARDGHESGWTECLERLAEHAASMRPSK